ncbi:MULTISPECIES: helix-turn-helix domain-containing protein [unclassified Leifsonia]|uniref:helix-turn-helix domain-containing protein n=1 Tax=unclassified Leifsonia TaxID=2663824 RepID=UPI000360545D|nr:MULTISPECIES: helix-turn-helix domain-containing protein [unclassified Leifsonia]TDP98414.1 AraC-like DNA-binding protein [Leifsonia sp. 115AMFTsu3.1]
MADFTRLHSHTSDPEEADAAMAAAGGRFAFAQLPQNDFSFDVDQAIDPSFAVARYAIGGQWETSGDFDDVVIVNVKTDVYRWDIDGERGFGARSPFLIRPGHDFTCFAEDSDVVNIFLSPQILSDVAATALGHEGPVVFGSAETRSPKHAEYMMTAATVAAEYMESGTFRHPLVRASLFHTLSLAALNCFSLSTDPREQAQTPTAQLESYRRAVGFIEDYASLPITVTDIAGAAGATIAQLHAAFRTHAGTTAQGYLQQVRLSAAHTELQVSDPATTDLADLAGRWGFADLDRFARRYREAYGMHPAVALQD